nr:unnamed protein product [Callosobruchus analis]
MRQVTGGPTNVRVTIALADQEYSSFLRKVQSGLWGSSTVAAGSAVLGRIWMDINDYFPFQASLSLSSSLSLPLSLSLPILSALPIQIS